MTRSKKRSRPRRPRLPSLKSLRNGNHNLWSKIIRLLFPLCVVCGVKPSEQSHHTLSKKFFSGLRFAAYAPVGIGVCCSCHIRVHASPALQALSLSTEDVERLRVLVREYRPIVWNRRNLLLVRAGLEEKLATIDANIKTGMEVAS